MQNRRNLYRILHVQPDAPAPIIKASYRTIMQTLRQHPDLGGEAEAAQLLNEAVAILCNPDRRAEYDCELSRSKARTDAPSIPLKTLGALDSAHSDITSIGGSCLFCKAHTPMASNSMLESYGDDGLCQRCGGARSLAANQAHDSVTTVRNEHRTAHTAIATLWQQWPLSLPLGVRIVDLSARGAALICSSEISAERTVLLKSPMVNAIARVQYCMRVSGAHQYRFGLTLSTLRMTSPPGEFLTVKA